MRSAMAFSPCGISGFFEVCNRYKDGRLIENPLHIGSRGGGIIIAKGATTKVTLEASSENRVEIYINGNREEARTSEWIVKEFLGRVGNTYAVNVDHQIDSPIGSGFGTSAAGALSCGLALSKALNLNLTYNQIAQVAHIADVVCHTGLGTVEGLTVGGIVLVVRSGAVGIGLVDRIFASSGLRIIAGSFQPIKKTNVILSDKIDDINQLARKTMKRILTNPCLENFLVNCKTFAFESGLASNRVKELIKDAERAGAIGASQNMIGEAVHAVVKTSALKDIYEVF